MSLGEVIMDFINQNTILVGGGGLFFLSLVAVCLGCMFIMGLKLKHNKLKKQVKRMKAKGEEREEKEKEAKRQKPGLRCVHIPSVDLTGSQIVSILIKHIEQ